MTEAGAGAGPRESADRRRLRRWAAYLRSRAVILAAVGVLAGASVSCGRTVLPSNPPSPVEGVVVAVDAASLTDVRGFTLRTSDGVTLAFRLGALENPTEFPPGHLTEHQATSSPVRVSFRAENGALVAYRLEDAAPSPAPSATPSR